MHKVVSLYDKLFELQMSPSFFFKGACCKRACVLKFEFAFRVETAGVSLCKSFQSVMEKKEHWSGRCQRAEPEGLDLTLRDEGVKKAFKDAGC